MTAGADEPDMRGAAGHQATLASADLVARWIVSGKGSRRPASAEDHGRPGIVTWACAARTPIAPPVSAASDRPGRPAVFPRSRCIDVRAQVLAVDDPCPTICLPVSRLRHQAQMFGPQADRMTSGRQSGQRAAPGCAMACDATRRIQTPRSSVLILGEPTNSRDAPVWPGWRRPRPTARAAGSRRPSSPPCGRTWSAPRPDRGSHR